MGINKVQYGNTTLIDLTSDTVTADKLMQGYTAHDRTGAIITGTATSGGGSVTQDQDGFIILPPDGGGSGGDTAELLKKWTYDQLIVSDEGVTLPSWSTSSQVLKSGSSMSPTLEFDLQNYCYFYNVRCLAYPIYSTHTDYKGKNEFTIYVYNGQVFNTPSNSMHSDSGTYLTSNITLVKGVSQIYTLYWSSDTKVLGHTTGYGGLFEVPTPTYSGNSFTFSSPSLTVRGNSTCYSQTAYDNTTDIRYQYVIEVYKLKRQNAISNSAGSITQQVDIILDSIDNNNKTLL